MLKPDDRLTLLSSLRPPPGFLLDYAICTTYSLDLYALLAAPLAFTGFEWESKTEGNAAADVQPLALLQALRRHASRLSIFCQAGAIHPPARHDRLFTYLEDSIIQVRAPSDNGVFHPKVWALRYICEDEVIYRLLVSSRNLTYDRSWDTLLVLEGSSGQRSQNVRNNARLGAFFEALPNLALQEVPQETIVKLRQFASELPKVQFAIPEPFAEMHFYPSGIPGGKTPTLPDRVDNLLIVSPFVSATHLKSLAEVALKDVTLVSRLDTLAALPADTFVGLSKVYTLNEDANPEMQDVTEEPERQITSQMSGLHAKLYIADTKWDAVVLTGSANATHAAATANVEFMVELVGKRSACGVEAFLGCDEGKNPNGFLTLLVEYPHDQHEQMSEDIQVTLEHQAGRIAIDLACAALRCSVSMIQQGEITGSDSLFNMLLSGTLPAMPGCCALRCWPISLGVARAHTLVAGGTVNMAFEGVTLLSVTPLFVFEITVSAGVVTFVKQVIVKVPLDGAPINRMEAVLINMLSDAGAFTRMLQLLMAGDEPIRLSTVFPVSATATPRSGNRGGQRSALFESLLRTFERAPERLDEIASMINDVCAAQQRSDVLPEGFDAIWGPIWQARQHQLALDLKSPVSLKPSDLETHSQPTQPTQPTQVQI